MNSRFIQAKGSVFALLCAACIPGQQLPTGFAQKSLAPKATFLQATSMALTDDGRIFIGELAGNVKIISGDSAKIIYHVNTFSGAVNGVQSEQGLLKILAHPNFRQKPWLYLYHLTSDYNTTTSHHNVDRVILDANNNVVKVDTIIQLPVLGLTVSTNIIGGRHNGSGMVFGHDGYLYVSRGQDEIFGANDPAPLWTSQKGKVLRFTEDGLPAPGNPHYNTAGASGEEKSIWATGFRNPWTMAYDPYSGRILEGDVGDRYEEINDVTSPESSKGYWYGYGPSRQDGQDQANSEPNSIPAIYWYQTNGTGGCAIVGTVPYNSAVPSNWPAQWKDKIYVSDYCNGDIVALPLNPTGNYHKDIYGGNNGMQTFATGEAPRVGLTLGPDGNLYFAGFSMDNNKHGAYEIYNTSAVTVRNPGNTLSIPETFAVGQAGDINLLLNGEFSLQDLGKAVFTVLGPDGRICWKEKADITGKYLRMRGFAPPSPGIFIVLLRWTSQGKERRAQGRMVVLP